MTIGRFQLKASVVVHEFNDHSGIVLFERRSGAALALQMTLNEFATLLEEPDEQVWRELQSHLTDFCQPFMDDE